MTTETIDIAIIGGGPAGLAAAEALTDAGYAPVLFDAMPSLGRKFLMAGKSGLNLTHSESFETLCERFGDRQENLQTALETFTPDNIRAWADDLGVETFVGSSGRVFPKEMKAAPLLRAWLRRLRTKGLETRVRHRWTGRTVEGYLTFETEGGPVTIDAAATILATGGASWARLGSDGKWARFLKDRKIKIAPFKPANCGFDVDWSPFFQEKFAGEPVKSVVLSSGDHSVKGDFVITKAGIEGSAVYAISASLRDRLDKGFTDNLTLDLTPDRSEVRLKDALSRPRGSRSFSSHLKRATGLSGVKANLVRECLDEAIRNSPARLAAGIKALPIPVLRTRPMDEAISTSGGLKFDELDSHMMIRQMPGVFAAGEMLDWEAPTGGYLLTACLATGRLAGHGAVQWLQNRA